MLYYYVVMADEISLFLICVVTNHNLILYIDNGDAMPRSPLNSLSDPT